MQVYQLRNNCLYHLIHIYGHCPVLMLIFSWHQLVDQCLRTSTLGQEAMRILRSDSLVCTRKSKRQGTSKIKTQNTYKVKYRKIKLKGEENPLNGNGRNFQMEGTPLIPLASMKGHILEYRIFIGLRPKLMVSTGNKFYQSERTTQRKKWQSNFAEVKFMDFDT